MNRHGIRLHEAAYPSVAKDAVLAGVVTNKQLAINAACAYNASASTMDVGLGARVNNNTWKIYSLTGAATDVSSLAQGTSSPATVFTTVNGQGFLIQAKNRFSLISLTINQAELGTPSYTYQYWNGSSWQTLALRNAPVYTAASSIAIVFAPPVDWAVGNGGAVSDLTTGPGFCIRVLAATAPTQAVQVSSMSIARMWAIRNIASKAFLKIDFREAPHVLEVGETIQAYFQAANSLNTVEVSYQVNG